MMKRELRDIEVIMADNCTRQEAINHLEKGAVVYESYEEYAEAELECGTPEDELRTLEELKSGILTGIKAVEVDGNIYVITYCL